MTSYSRALKRERDRERKWRQTAQGAFESSMVRLDMMPHDDETCDGMFTDRERGAEKIRSFDEGLSQSGADVSYAEKAILHYRRRYCAAYKRLKRSRPHLVRTFSLICKYGKNRLASIAELQAETKDWDAAHRLYFFHREKILNFFRVQ